MAPASSAPTQNWRGSQAACSPPGSWLRGQPAAKDRSTHGCEDRRVSSYCTSNPLLRDGVSRSSHPQTHPHPAQEQICSAQPGNTTQGRGQLSPDPGGRKGGSSRRPRSLSQCGPVPFTFRLSPGSLAPTRSHQSGAGEGGGEVVTSGVALPTHLDGIWVCGIKADQRLGHTRGTSQGLDTRKSAPDGNGQTQKDKCVAAEVPGAVKFIGRKQMAGTRAGGPKN